MDSNLFTTKTGKGKSERKYIGKLESTLLISVNLTPLEIYLDFHPDILLSKRVFSENDQLKVSRWTYP